MIHILNPGADAPSSTILPKQASRTATHPPHPSESGSAYRFDRDPDRPIGRFLRRTLREPLLQFLLAGAALYALGMSLAKDKDRYLIRMDDDQVGRLAQTYLGQYGAAPTESQLKDLTEREIREEILFREGQALELGKGDAIIRRRVAQKFEFLQQDRIVAREPSELELRDLFAAHRDLYAKPERVTFTHIFFSPDRGGPVAAHARALAALARLQASDTPRAPELGDRFPDQYDYSGLDRKAVARVFGDSPVADSVFTARTGWWAGPYHSGYGEHLVRVTARQAPVTVFPDVRDKVREDWLADFRQRENEKAFAGIRSRYTVAR